MNGEITLIIFLAATTQVSSIPIEAGTEPHRHQPVTTSSHHTSNSHGTHHTSNSHETHQNQEEVTPNPVEPVPNHPAGPREPEPAGNNNIKQTFLNMLQSMFFRVGGVNGQLNQAIHDLGQGLSESYFDFNKGIAYLPYLFFVDGPTHFFKTVMAFRDQGIPTDYRSASNALAKFVSDSHHREIVQRLFVPITTFPEKMISTVQNFARDVIKSMSNLAGR